MTHEVSWKMLVAINIYLITLPKYYTHYMIKTDKVETLSYLKNEHSWYLQKEY